MKDGNRSVAQVGRAAPPATTPPPSGSVYGLVEEINSAIGNLTGNIQGLEGRIDVVLQPADKPSDTGVGPIRGQSPLEHDLSRILDNLYILNGYVNGIRERVRL